MKVLLTLGQPRGGEQGHVGGTLGQCVSTGPRHHVDGVRLLEAQQDNFFDGPISDVMTRSPVTVATGTKTMVAVETLACRNLSELPVVDASNRPIGLIDITDVVSLMPKN